RLGLGYEFGGVRKLVDVVGPAYAKEIFFTARQFSADEAHAMGLVNRVVAGDGLETAVRDCAQGIAANAPLTVASIKTLVEQALYDAAKKEREFTVYTAHYDTETIADICAAFDKKYPGVKCNFVRTTAQVAYQRFQQDLKANLAVASVFSSTDISHYPELKNK